VGRVSNRVPRHRIKPSRGARAADLRNGATYPERRLWQLLRSSQLSGLKFRRQHVIEPYVVDFCCPSHRVVVEVDGESHVGTGRSDAARDRFLESLGFRVVRVTNDDVLRDIESVANAILLAAGMNPFQRVAAPTPKPPPSEREGEEAATPAE
jgi:very-short-patch-repair endonuclease